MHAPQVAAGDPDTLKHAILTGSTRPKAPMRARSTFPLTFSRNLVRWCCPLFVNDPPLSCTRPCRGPNTAKSAAGMPCLHLNQATAIAVDKGQGFAIKNPRLDPGKEPSNEPAPNVCSNGLQCPGPLTTDAPAALGISNERSRKTGPCRERRVQ